MLAHLKSKKWDVLLNFAPGGPPMANLDMEPLDIMGDWYQVERKPTLKPPVVEILFFTEKTQMFQINDDPDICKIQLQKSGVKMGEKNATSGGGGGWIKVENKMIKNND